MCWLTYILVGSRWVRSMCVEMAEAGGGREEERHCAGYKEKRWKLMMLEWINTGLEEFMLLHLYTICSCDGAANVDRRAGIRPRGKTILICSLPCLSPAQKGFLKQFKSFADWESCAWMREGRIRDGERVGNNVRSSVVKLHECQSGRFDDYSVTSKTKY